MEVVELFLKGAAERFKKGMEAAAAAAGDEIGCVMSDAFFWFAGDMAGEMKVPWVALWTSGPRPLFLHLETDLIRENLKSSGTPHFHHFLTLIMEYGELDDREILQVTGRGIVSLVGFVSTKAF